MTLKKAVSISVVVAPLLLNADFIGSAIGNISSGGLNNITSKTKDLAMSMGTNSATNFLFNSSQMSGFWNAIGGSYTTGTIEICYKRTGVSNATTPNICSMLGNANLDVCGLMPKTLAGGLYTKKSSSERSRLEAPLRDWCNKYLQSGVNTQVKEIKEHMGISGKKASSINSSSNSSFLSDAKKAVNDKSASITDYYDKLSGKGSDNSYSKKYRQLQEAGYGSVANAEIKKIATLNKDIAPSQLAEVGTKPVFSSMAEYRNDLFAKTAADAVAQRQFFNLESHVDIANSQFDSLNQQKKSLADKKNFIDEYIENEKTGFRKQIQGWAEEMADQEILYARRSNERYYSSFDERNILNNVAGVSRDKDVMLTIANYEIAKQQHSEAAIMLKWREIADGKADELKTKLIKNMYASEVFDEATARAEIQQMIK